MGQRARGTHKRPSCQALTGMPRRDSTAGVQAGQCGGQAGQYGGQAGRYEECAGQIRQGQIGKCLALSKPIQHVHAVYERE